MTDEKIVMFRISKDIYQNESKTLKIVPHRKSWILFYKGEEVDSDDFLTNLTFRHGFLFR